MESVPSVGDTVAQVYFLLDEKGYPSDVFVYDAGGDEHFVPHSAVVDPKTGLELAFIETMGRADESEMRRLATAHLDLRKRQGFNVPVFLLCRCDHDEYKPKVFRLHSEHGWEAIRSEDFPAYEALSKNREVQDYRKEKEERVSAADELKSATEKLVVFLLGIFLLSLFQLIQVGHEELILLAGISVLIVLPHYEVIKAANFELRRRDSSGLAHNKKGDAELGRGPRPVP